MTIIATKKNATIINIKLKINPMLPNILPAFIAVFLGSNLFACALNTLEIMPNPIPSMFIIPNDTNRITLPDVGKKNGGITILDTALKVIAAIISETIPKPKLLLERGREVGVLTGACCN